MTQKEQLGPAEKMMRQKRGLIKSLQSQILEEKAKHKAAIEKIEFRIRQAQTIISALEKGTLKP